MWKIWSSKRHTVLLTWFTSPLVPLNPKHSAHNRWFSKRGWIMTISLQSTFHTIHGSLPGSSTHSDLRTCPLFLDLVIYLLSGLLILRKSRWPFCRHTELPADAALLHETEQGCWSCSLSCHQFPAKPAVERDKHSRALEVLKRKVRPESLSQSQLYLDLNGSLLLGNI